jgi:histidine ammonia-lyase
MGGGAANKLATVLDNVEYLLAIELIAAAQACEMNRELIISPVCRELLAEFREIVQPLIEDRILAEDIELGRHFVATQGVRWAERMIRGNAAPDSAAFRKDTGS